MIMLGYDDKLAPFLVGGLISVPILYFAVLYISSLADPRFTFQEMDLNSDGFVSFSEAVYVSSSGTRETVVNGKNCEEYFAYKDGLTIKTVCGEAAL